MLWIAAHAEHTDESRVFPSVGADAVDPLLAKLAAERGPGGEVAGHAVDATTRWRR